MAITRAAAWPGNVISHRRDSHAALRLGHAACLGPAILTGCLWLKGLHPGLPGISCPFRALTGIPCPTCYVTRAAAAALRGDLASSIQWHAFGPPVAAALLWWSFSAIHQRRLLPRRLPAWPLGWGAAALLAYWLLRLGLSFGLGIRGFPGFPAA